MRKETSMNNAIITGEKIYHLRKKRNTASLVCDISVCVALIANMLLYIVMNWFDDIKIMKTLTIIFCAISLCIFLTSGIWTLVINCKISNVLSENRKYLEK